MKVILFKIIISTVIGMAIGASLVAYFQSAKNATTATTNEAEQPLYWVAPMDANYRRDKPGKSPMGMDLVPVYASEQSSNHDEVGVVTIAPHVVNNLGVRTATASVKTIENKISALGQVKYNEDHIVHIHPRVEGWVEKLYVNSVGEQVAANQPLYSLYSPQLVNAQQEYLVALEQAQNLNQQELIIAATEKLKALRFSDGAIKTLTETKVVKNTTTYFAPQSGIVNMLTIRDGFYVKPGDTLISIAKLDHIWVEAEILERDISQITEKLPVTMRLDYLPGKLWHGEIDYVYPSLNSQNRTLRIRVKFDNPEHQLKPNMFAQLAIKTKAQQPSLVVPFESVIRTGKQNRVVLALGDGQFKSISVDIGRVFERYIEILSGLAEGDEVVSSAQFLLDSESSKTSDFTRMQAAEQPEAVWMQGVINNLAVNEDDSTVNITHQAVPEWQWPEMTMDFAFEKSLDTSELQLSQTLHFEVTKLADGSFEITTIHIVSDPAPQAVSSTATQATAQATSQATAQATVEGTINSIDVKNSTINISRGPIEKWNRPAATMDFIASEQIALTDFNVGDKVNFTFEVGDDFVITEMSLKDALAHH